MENRSLIERLARQLSANDPSDWPARVEDAASILALLKEPDDAMREAGDVMVWGAMIDAALRTRWSVAPSVSQEEPAIGSDEEGEIRLTPDAVGNDRAEWIHLHQGQEKPS
ncbi:hypothetical protein [Sphingobium sp. TCM1]|uniref:hypothetical protein n=1 Tax=Sphingobium sp. TCM1 TaxID=453246 RepID=UPI0007F3FDFF|nr:hypothetical protein [Sphingobium sp. TCM1]OAN59136.1 hypothetical protein A7Q26_12985 [Sphingobium sp. TCM1]